ncbi:MAG: DUF1007 family protein [Halomonas sp.]|uniref:DUF1007 family protein n=1 Tax=Halomonas sp. TaxID=1486246 RepID=UPI003970B7A7
MLDNLQRHVGLAATALLCLTMSALAHAHPHGWIDLRMRLVVDDQGHLTGLHQSWRMDPFYSLVVLEELGQAGGDSGLDAALDQLGSEIRDNLVPYGYYTELTLAGETLSFDQVNDYTVLERGGRVEFIFLLPLAEPQPLAGQTLHYQVFDPTYYIEMVHEEENREPADDALQVGGALTCETRIQPADPDPDKVMQAAMLDVDDAAEPGLGRHFAETGEVTCR